VHLKDFNVKLKISWQMMLL